MSKTKGIFRLLTLVYSLICALGCYIQIKSITDSFFEYAITTQVIVELPTSLQLPTLSICFRIVDVFDWDQYVNKSKINVTSLKDIRTREIPIEKLLPRITIKDIFKFASGNKDRMITSCIYRKPGSYDFIYLTNTSDCHTIFTITNFYLQEFLCYKIELGKYKGDEYHYRSAAFALSYPGVLFSVAFNVSTFSKSEWIKVIINEANQIPYRSAAFTPSVGRFYNKETKLARYNWFTTTYYIVTNELLPPPHSTQCVDYNTLGFSDSEDCIKQCLVKDSVTFFQRYPYSVYEQEPMNQRIITVNQLQTNASINKVLYRFERRCWRKCERMGCKVSYTITQVTKDPNNDFMTFNVHVPQFPSYFIKFNPRLQFIEYFIYVLSCFGTWFGLSILSLNPFQYKGWLEKLHLHQEQPGMNNNHQHNPYSSRRKGILERASDINNRGCLYCSQTRIVILSDLKQRLNLLQYLRSQYQIKTRPELQ